jgi:dolichyl-diphosphooligosaccharide--protein glycosyltransferase
MSTRSLGDEDTAQSVVDYLEDWYHVPALLVVMAAMLRIRLSSYGNYVEGGEVMFSGNDAWYHLREVQWTVRHWPATMPFDPWTYFPYGTNAGQFGTLYDQLVATAALAVGLGSPSDALVAKTLLVAPAVFGALTALPVYYLGKRVGNRLAGLLGALVLALLPGLFLRRTLVGVADHNGVEPFFQAVAVLGLVVAFSVAEREKPIWELVVDRDLDALRRPLLYAALGGVGLSLYMWVWPPGVLLVGVLGVFLVLKLSSDVVNGGSPEPIAFAGAVAAAVAGVLMLGTLESVSFSPTNFSLVQPVFSFAVAGGAIFMAFLAREWESRDLDPWLYPVVVLATIGIGLGVVAVALPDLLKIVVNNLQRIVGFSAGAQTRTIGEAQPFLDPDLLARSGVDAVGRIVSEYGFAFFTAIAAAVWMLAKPLWETEDSTRYGFVVASLTVVGLLFLIPAIPRGIGDLLGLNDQLVGLAIVTAIVVGAALLARHSATNLFVVVWAAFVTAAAFTQLRFNYYLAVAVAVMNAYFIAQVFELDLVGMDSVRDVTDVKAYQVLVVLVVVMVVLMPVFVVPLSVRNTGNPSVDSTNTAWQVAKGQSPGSVAQWDGSLQWMEANTPSEGTLGGATNEMDYYGTYQGTDDFSYPEGAYGVMSWWDYGHWITVRGHRIPNANPFQQGANPAADYLLAPNVTAAEDVLRGLSSEGEQTRFVMVDWQMASTSSKFGAPIVFYDRTNVSRSEFYERVYTTQFRNSFTVKHQRYYESMMIRLYEFHGSAVRPQPVVVDWDERTAQTRSGRSISVKTVPADQNETSIKTFSNVSAARAFVERDGSAQLGGVGPYPEERVPALEHYRLVRVSESSALQSRQYQQSLLATSRVGGIGTRALIGNQPSWVKTFERVPGATVEGSGAPSNATISVGVRMRTPTNNETFTYRQRTTADANGEFTLTLPYSTTGYDEYGPENGYTNVSVRATGPYVVQGPTSFNGTHITQYGANLSVPEGAVNGAREEPIQLELERRSQSIATSNETGNASDVNPSPGDLDRDAAAATAPVDGAGTTASVEPSLSSARVAPRVR